MKKNILEFINKYVEDISFEIRKLDKTSLEKAILLLKNSIQNEKTIFVCGNGGSAAISNHYICDYLKLIRTNTKYKPKVISLSSNLELITAISNDISYSEIFSYQLESLAKKGDLLILVSSSGNSTNIIKAINVCKKKGVKTLGFSGFSGGKLKKKVNCCIHLNLNNYGKTEDSHHILMHCLMHYFVMSFKNKKNLKL